MSSFVYQKQHGGGFPCCYICGMGFETNSHEDDINDLDGTYGDDDILHRHCGLYKIRQLLRKPFVKHLGWYCFYRVILYNTRLDSYRISGMAAHIAVDPDHQQPLEAVPRGLMMGAIGYPEKHKDRLFLAMGLDQDDDTSAHGLVGYHAHSSCMTLLAHHPIARRDLDLALSNLILLPPDLNLLPEDAWQEDIDKKRFLNDPASIKYVQSLINRARIRTRARFHIKGRVNRKHNRLCYLPVEILYKVMDPLPSGDLVNVQIAMKYYLGDAYWRKRVPVRLFYEVKGVWDETLDWQFLCLELEWLSETEGLAFRRYILDRLDELQASLNEAANE